MHFNTSKPIPSKARLNPFLFLLQGIHLESSKWLLVAVWLQRHPRANPEAGCCTGSGIVRASCQFTSCNQRAWQTEIGWRYGTGMSIWPCSHWSVMEWKRRKIYLFWPCIHEDTLQIQSFSNTPTNSQNFEYSAYWIRSVFGRNADYGDIRIRRFSLNGNNCLEIEF